MATTRFFKALAVIGFLGALGPGLPGRLGAADSKGVAKVKHFLGMEHWQLKTVESDPKTGKPSLEKGSEDGEPVERRTTYHANGRMASQETEVRSLESHKVLYTEKKSWDARGRLEGEFTESDAYNSEGRQDWGESRERSYEHGRLTKEVKKAWPQGGDGWIKKYEAEISYYPDGDMKERVTRDLAAGEESRESWGEKGAMGRKKKTERWDSNDKRWK